MSEVSYSTALFRHQLRNIFWLRARLSHYVTFAGFMCVFYINVPHGFIRTWQEKLFNAGAIFGNYNPKERERERLQIKKFVFQGKKSVFCSLTGCISAGFHNLFYCGSLNLRSSGARGMLGPRLLWILW